MAEGIVYLDVDDEITSAASRIRSSPGTKVALVVPNGSRIATSRINFRLLSREALVSNRRLSVIAGEPASRALAASAGLPVFATVAEYEAALAGPSAPVDDDPGQGAMPMAAEPSARPEPAPRPEPRTSPRSKRGARAEAAAAAAAAATAGTAATGSGSSRVADETSQLTVPFDALPTADERAFEPHERRSLPVVVGNRFRVRASVVAVLAALGLAIVVIAVAGFLLLPSATIALTPRQDTVGPIQVTIAADPTATAVDATKGVVPADRLDVPAEASQTFTTTGTKITEAAATGSVTFTNYDPTSSNSIAAGSIVSTEGGIGFRTLAAVTVARAAFTPPSTTVPAHASVRVQAVKAGTEGNVPANAIRVVPPGENPTFLAVANPNPTSGGVHTETPQVSKADVDKAIATLQKALQASFDDAISAGAGAPTGTELFPSTAAMGAPTFSVDPTSLVGQAVSTFDLGMTASGTVIAVDPSPVRSIAETRLSDRIGADHRLVDGSIQVDVGKGSVGEDGQVSFEATARAAEVTVVDPNQLRALVKGMTASEAESALAPFGVAKVELWPAWVTTVTGVDARLSISVVGQDGAGGGGGAAPSTSTSTPPAASPGAPLPSPSAASAAP